MIFHFCLSPKLLQLIAPSEWFQTFYMSTLHAWKLCCTSQSLFLIPDQEEKFDIHIMHTYICCWILLYNGIYQAILYCINSFSTMYLSYDGIEIQETGTIFTHHQKTVILDADAGNHKRKIIAFVGGLDLCGGRYDTPSHPLFRSLQTVHKEDYYNPNFAVSI